MSKNCSTCKNWDKTPVDPNQGNMGSCHVLAQELRVSITKPPDSSVRLDYMLTPPIFTGCEGYSPALKDLTLENIQELSAHVSKVSQDLYRKGKKTTNQKEYDTLKDVLVQVSSIQGTIKDFLL